MTNELNTYIQNQILTKPKKINENLNYNNQPFLHRSEYKKLIGYVDDFLEGRNINRYLVLPGIRGVGKSTLLIQIYEYLLKEKHLPSTNILYVSCDNLKKMTGSSIMDAVTCYLKIYHNAIPKPLKNLYSY